MTDKSAKPAFNPYPHYCRICETGFLSHVDLVEHNCEGEQ